MAIEPRPTHTPHIAVYALVQGIQQTAMVVPGLQAAQAIEACSDGNVIVLLAMVSLPPAVQALTLVIRLGCIAPLLIASLHLSVPVWPVTASLCPFSSLYQSYRQMTSKLLLRSGAGLVSGQLKLRPALNQNNLYRLPRGAGTLYSSGRVQILSMRVVLPSAYSHTS